jgi:hypothetical protein
MLIVKEAYCTEFAEHLKLYGKKIYKRKQFIVICFGKTREKQRFLITEKRRRYGKISLQFYFQIWKLVLIAF